MIFMNFKNWWVLLWSPEGIDYEDLRFLWNLWFETSFPVDELYDVTFTLKFRGLNMGHQGRNRKPCPRTLKISRQILWKMHKNISKICRRISILLEVMGDIVGLEIKNFVTGSQKNDFWIACEKLFTRRWYRSLKSYQWRWSHYKKRSEPFLSSFGY